MNLGLTGMVLLGRGDDYLEGSIVLPCDKEGKMTCIGISFWARDFNQKDRRFGNRTYHLLLISVKRKYEPLFLDRQIWEVYIRDQIKRKLQEGNELNEELIEDLIPHALEEIISWHQIPLDTEPRKLNT